MPIQIHGAHHAPGGSDPIPVGFPIVASGVNTSGQTVTHGTTSNCSFSDVQITSDSSLLSWSTTTTTDDTLNLHGQGMAMLIAGCKWTAGTAVDFKIFSGDGLEMFPHDGFSGFSGLGPVSGGSMVLPTLMDISWVLTNEADLTPLIVKMTNSDGTDSGPSDAYLACMFWPGIIAT